MLKDILLNSKEIILQKDNTKIHNPQIKELLTILLEGSYFAPSYNYADDMRLTNETTKGLWIIFTFDNPQDFKGNQFEELWCSIKPKHNWLTLYRKIEGKFDGKCLNLNLATNTTNIYSKLEAIENV